MNLAEVMQEVADRLGGAIPGLQTFGYPAPLVTAPAAYPDWPEELTFDATMARGCDRLTLPLSVVVARVDDEAARDELGAYCDGAGVKSVKAVIESADYHSFDAVRVVGAEFRTYSVADVEHIGARFTLDIIGTGA